MAGTIQQIADMAGVSRGTVDRALNNRGRINPEIKEEILRIADEIGYIPRKRLRRQNKKEKVIIGVVTQLASASFMTEIHRGIQDAAQVLKDRGVELSIKQVLSVDEEEQVSAIEKLSQEGMAGLAVMPADSDKVRKKLNDLTESGIPIVTFNSDIVGTGRVCFVGMDNRKSGRTAAGLMGLLTAGRGKVLIITGFFTNNANSSRVDGFIEEMKRAYPDVEIAGVLGSYDDEKEVEKIIVSTLTRFMDLNGIFVVSGGQAGIGKAFDSLNLLQRPKVIIYDLTPKNISALQNDIVDFLIDQEGYAQGYRPPLILADILLKGQSPDEEFIYTAINIKTKHNIT